VFVIKNNNFTSNWLAIQVKLRQNKLRSHLKIGLELIFNRGISNEEGMDGWSS
jgi:hypothetical protein